VLAIFAVLWQMTGKKYDVLVDKARKERVWILNSLVESRCLTEIKSFNMRMMGVVVEHEESQDVGRASSSSSSTVWDGLFLGWLVGWLNGYYFLSVNSHHPPSSLMQKSFVKISFFSLHTFQMASISMDQTQLYNSLLLHKVLATTY